MTKIYNFNPETKEFVGEFVARKSPLEDNVYLTPANSTNIAPPQKEQGKALVFENGSWVQRDDKRGAVFHDLKGVQYIQRSIGLFPDWAITDYPEDTGEDPEKYHYYNIETDEEFKLHFSLDDDWKEKNGYKLVVTPEIPDGKKLTLDVEVINGNPTYTLINITEAEKIAYLQRLGVNLENSAFTFGGMTEDGTEEHRRNVKETIDFIRELGGNAPATTPWNSPNHGDQSVTLADLLGWLLGVGERRFKRFVIQTATKENISDYQTFSGIEAAFNEAYNA